MGNILPFTDFPLRETWREKRDLSKLLTSNGQFTYYKEVLESELNGFSDYLIIEIVSYAVDEKLVRLECIGTNPCSVGYVDSCYALSNGNIAIFGTTHSNSWIKLWDMKEMRCILTLENANYLLGPQKCCSLSNGDVVFPCRDDHLHLWSLQTHKRTRTLEHHENSVTWCCVHPSGNVVTTSDDKTLKIWDMDNMACVGTLEGHTNIVLSCCILPNSNIVSSSVDCTLRIWDIATLSCTGILEGHTSSVATCCSLSNGNIVSFSRPNFLKVWNTDTRTCISTLESDYVHRWHKVGSGIILSCHGFTGHQIKMWDTGMKHIRTIGGSYFKHLCVLPDGIIISITGSRIKQWEFKLRDLTV